MFIKPVKRSKYTLQRFAKHKDIETSEYFRLQERKKYDAGDKAKGYFQYRIVTKGNPYYEIAFSNDYEDIRDNEWKYCVDEIPKQLPINLNEKATITWIISHFTCKGMENSVSDMPAVDEPVEVETEEHGLLRRTSLKLHHAPSPKMHDTLEYNPYAHDTHALGVMKVGGIVAFLITVVFSNLLILLLREATLSTFITSIIGLDTILFLIIVLGMPTYLGVTFIDGHSSSASSTLGKSNNYSSGQHIEDAMESSDDDDDDDTAIPDNIDVAIVSSNGSNIVKAVKSGTEVTRNGYVPGLTINQASSLNDIQAYCDPLGQSFNVRTGPNYRKNQLKAPSSKSLFDLIAMDVFKNKKKINHIGQYIDLELLSSRTTAPYISLNSAFDEQLTKTLAEHDMNMPQHVAAQLQADKTDPRDDVEHPILGSLSKKYIIIITMQIPTFEPSMMSTVPDGVGFSLVWYLRATDETQRDLLRDTPVSPAVRLLKQLILAEANSDEETQLLTRMKALPRLVNDDEFDLGWTLGKTVKKYNGKPFLTRPQHHLYKGPGYMNYDLNIYSFCYLARKVLHGFVPKVEKIVLDWAFTLEAYDDEEQPEVILGCVRIFKMNPNFFPSWEATMEALQAAKTAPLTSTSNTAVNAGNASGSNTSTGNATHTGANGGSSSTTNALHHTGTLASSSNLEKTMSSDKGLHTPMKKQNSGHHHNNANAHTEDYSNIVSSRPTSPKPTRAM